MIFREDWFIGKSSRSPGILEVRAPLLNYLFDRNRDLVRHDGGLVRHVQMIAEQ